MYPNPHVGTLRIPPYLIHSISSPLEERVHGTLRPVCVINHNAKAVGGKAGRRPCEGGGSRRGQVSDIRVVPDDGTTEEVLRAEIAQVRNDGWVYSGDVYKGKGTRHAECGRKLKYSLHRET